MKKIYFVGVLVLFNACGNHNFSYDPAPSGSSSGDGALRQPSVSEGGLMVTVRNALPQVQGHEERITPHLNAYFCSPMPTGDSPVPSTEERCVRLSGVVQNGAEQVFYVSREDLAQVYQRGAGMASFEFADDYQLTSVPWHCYAPNDRVALDSNLDSRQSWHVTVNQRYSFSYGCLIDRR